MAIYNVISPNLTSNIWWMGTLYGAYMVFMAVEFCLLVTGQIQDRHHRRFLRRRRRCRGPQQPGRGLRHAGRPRVLVRAVHAHLLHRLGHDVGRRRRSSSSPGSAYKINGEEMDEPMKRALEVDDQDRHPADRGHPLLHRLEVHHRVRRRRGQDHGAQVAADRPVLLQLLGAGDRSRHDHPADPLHQVHGARTSA